MLFITKNQYSIGYSVVQFNVHEKKDFCNKCTYRKWISAISQSGNKKLFCMSVALNMFRSFGFDRDQMISNLQRMFPAWIMTLSIWLISSGGQSTTKQISTSSTDYLNGIGTISSRMAYLLLLPVFLSLSCMLFPIFQILLAASVWKTTKHTFLYP